MSRNTFVYSRNMCPLYLSYKTGLCEVSKAEEGPFSRQVELGQKSSPSYVTRYAKRVKEAQDDTKEA